MFARDTSSRLADPLLWLTATSRETIARVSEERSSWGDNLRHPEGVQDEPNSSRLRRLQGVQRKPLRGGLIVGVAAVASPHTATLLHAPAIGVQHFVLLKAWAMRWSPRSRCRWRGEESSWWRVPVADIVHQPEGLAVSSKLRPSVTPGERPPTSSTPKGVHNEPNSSRLRRLQGVQRKPLRGERSTSSARPMRASLHWWLQTCVPSGRSKQSPPATRRRLKEALRGTPYRGCRGGRLPPHGDLAPRPGYGRAALRAAQGRGDEMVAERLMSVAQEEVRLGPRAC